MATSAMEAKSLKRHSISALLTLTPL